MSNSLLQQHDDSTGVKICGLMDEKCVDVAIGAGADAIGFVFAPTSPRVINRNQADRLIDQIPDGVLAIAVLFSLGSSIRRSSPDPSIRYVVGRSKHPTENATNTMNNTTESVTSNPISLRRLSDDEYLGTLGSSS